MKYRIIIICMVYMLLCCNQHQSQKVAEVRINMADEIGMIRPLNGGNLGPVCNLKMLDLTEEYKDLHIPYIRTHDVPWFSASAVDIHTIFRDFRLDPSEESNYDFRQTDDYIASLVGTGANIVYRLGESIEHTQNKYFVHPPEDYDKWADICCGIIRHYNHGWANGFHYNIRYWEIWNEPDIKPSCWTGTDEQFLDLYNTAAKKIKEEFPDVKIGGPALASPVDIKNGDIVASELADEFLTSCRRNSVPLDFFSWHKYGNNPWESARQATHVLTILDRNGFTDTESHMNEWNLIPDNNWSALMTEQGTVRAQAYSDQSGIKGAAFIASVLMLLQDEPLDMANFYTTTAGLFGIFSEYGEPHKAYYALKAFTELLETPVRIETNYDWQDGIVFCCGTNDEHSGLTVLASNFRNDQRKIHFDFANSFFTSPVKYELFIIDEVNNLSRLKEKEIKDAKSMHLVENMKPFSVLLLKITPVT